MVSLRNELADFLTGRYSTRTAPMVAQAILRQRIRSMSSLSRTARAVASILWMSFLQRDISRLKAVEMGNWRGFLAVTAACWYSRAITLDECLALNNSEISWLIRLVAALQRIRRVYFPRQFKRQLGRLRHRAITDGGAGAGAFIIQSALRQYQPVSRRRRSGRRISMSALKIRMKR